MPPAASAVPLAFLAAFAGFAAKVALAPGPQILFADEPTGNLDTGTGAGIVELMFSLNAERGTTLFLVTHEESLAKRCDRIVRLADGKIMSDSGAAPYPEPVEG